MEGLVKEELCDSTTGEAVEVIVSPNGRFFHIEGFSWDFIQNARKALHNTVNESQKNKGTPIKEIKDVSKSKAANKPTEQRIG